MNTKKYMQTDGAWSELGCPAYPCYIGRDGCGLVSIANILIEMEQYAQYTPATIQPYCKKFMASDCEGTIWSGVPVMLKHYGLTEVMEHQNFSTLWPELAKGNRVVFFIMGSYPGGSKRVKWTSGGHCVCSVDYKYENGLHKVYMKDSYSNSPLRNGWISYEENIRGACLAIWSGKLVGTPTPTPTPPEPGKLVVDGICGAETVMAMEQFFGVTIDGEISGQLSKWSNYYPSITAISYGGGGSRVIYKLQEWLGLSGPDGILGPNTTKAWQKRIRDYGYFANPQETIDGIIGAKTMKAWQECLNNGCKPKGQPIPPAPTPTPTDKIPENGVGDATTVKAMQKAWGLTQDGVISGQYATQKKYRPALTAVQNGRGGSKTVTALQKWCGLSDPDGYWGGNTSSGLQRKLRDLGYLAKTESIDNICGAKTMKAFQECLNNNLKPKSEPTPPTPTPTPTTDTKVIDVSDFQPSIDFTKVKADGVQGVIVKCGFRHGEGGALDEDSDFMRYIKGAYDVGLPVGIYFFTEAINAQEGKEEAQYTIKLWQKAGIPISYPIGIDSEEVFWKNPDGSTGKGRANSDKLSKAKRTEAIKAFCEEIKAQGYTPMIYASLNWFDDCLDMSQLPYDVWCAQYYKECQYKGDVVMWQYTSEGKVNGIPKTVDLNHCYIEPKKVNPPTPQPTPDPKSYSGAFPTEAEIREASNKGIHNNICTWCYDTWKSGKYGYIKFDEQEECPLCHPRSTDLGWQCIGWDFASWRHGGGIPCNCWYGVLYNSLGDNYYYMSNLEILKSLQERIGVKDIQLIRHDNNPISASELEKSDLLMFYNGKTFCHMGVYVGNDKISDAANKADGIRYGAPYSEFKCLIAIRYTGSRSYIMKGDEGKAVLEWQDFLNWWSDGQFYKECGAGDIYFGNNTHKWTVKFQTAVFGASEADGTVGQKTISKAKSIRK